MPICRRCRTTETAIVLYTRKAPTKRAIRLRTKRFELEGAEHLLDLGVPGLGALDVHVAGERRAEPAATRAGSAPGSSTRSTRSRRPSFPRWSCAAAISRTANWPSMARAVPASARRPRTTKGLRPVGVTRQSESPRLQAVGPGVLFGQQDRVGIGEETERIGQFRCRASIVADARVASMSTPRTSRPRPAARRSASRPGRRARRRRRRASRRSGEKSVSSNPDSPAVTCSRLLPAT